jgi:PIN domain
MPGDPRKIYWDSCVFLSWINKAVDRLPHIDWYLKRSGTEHQIITSAFTVAEVAFAEMERRNGVLDDSVMERIDRLWIADNSPIKLVELYPAVVFEARDLARRAIADGWGTIKGGDAVHLATAVHMKAVAIHTYSRDWPGKSPLVGDIPIGPPIAETPEFEFSPPPATDTLEI